MSIVVAYWCVLAAALLPYVWTAVAKAGARDYDNHDPRAWMARQQAPHRQRANAAQLNAFEAFPVFAASVALAHLAGVEPGTVAMLSLVFIGARVMHGLMYLADLAALRSLAWFVALGSAVSLLVLATRSVA